MLLGSACFSSYHFYEAAAERHVDSFGMLPRIHEMENGRKKRGLHSGQQLLSGVDFGVRRSVKSAAILLRSPRAFPLSVWATFKREIRIFTYKFIRLSRSCT